MSFSIKQRRAKRNYKKPLVFWSVFLLITFVGVIAAWLYIKKDTSTNVSVTPATKNQVNVVAAEQVFSTPYFQFSADDNWQLREDGTVADSVYMYSQYDYGRVQRHLRVYVNSQNARFQVPYIVPVQLKDNKIIAKGFVSQHCRQGDKDSGVGERMTVLDGVEFLCDVDATTSRMAAGLIDGGYAIAYTRSDGQQYNLIIEYEDVSYTSVEDIFIRILDSFELK